MVSLARFISLFPQPASKDPLEQEANKQLHQHLVNQLVKIEHQVNRNTESIVENKSNIERFNGTAIQEQPHQDLVKQLEELKGIVRNQGNTEQPNTYLNVIQEESRGGK